MSAPRPASSACTAGPPPSRIDGDRERKFQAALFHGVHRVSDEPEGWFEPCTCEWQFMQLPSASAVDGEALPGRPRRPVREARVALLRMARLAEQRAAQLDHARVARAVRRVAGRAVLGHRRVLPEHRAALLGVALVAGVVHRRAHQLALGASCRAARGSRCRRACPAAPGARTAFRNSARSRDVAGVADVGLRAASEHRILRARGCRGTRRRRRLFASCGPMCQFAAAVDFSWQPRHIAFCTRPASRQSRPNRIIDGRVSPFLTRFA